MTVDCHAVAAARSEGEFAHSSDEDEGETVPPFMDARVVVMRGRADLGRGPLPRAVA